MLAQQWPRVDTRTCPGLATRCRPCGDAVALRSLLQFWSSQRAELVSLLAQHVLLIGVSIAAAVAAAVPLGILAARRPLLAAPLTGLANVVQTIPSLAMFGFL